ncbi:MAG TPA: glycoside hydrolase family 5 protein [Xanthobacteraceae bacterium]|nr:glycoside hydrolase family 5 protein [Xanthobacteraceae bacterium]
MRWNEQFCADKRLLAAVALALAAYAALSSSVTSQSRLRLTGVNIAGAEFGTALPGRPGTDYFYPSPQTIDHFAAKGMNTVRLPFRWERIQPALGAPLEEAEFERLDSAVHRGLAQGMTVLLDVHNYAAYRKQPIGSTAVPVDALADLWGRLAARYKDKPGVVFGLMNEPKGLPTETWLAAANAAIAEIRRRGARNLVLVPGNGWTGAHSWLGGGYGTANAAVMTKISDPAHHFAYEVHQYLDADFSGTHPQCQSETIGAEKLKAFTDWLRQRRRKGFLGEFGAGAGPTCLAALEAMLAFIDRNADVWLGWTYWAAGPWPRDYFTSLQPIDGEDRPQMAILEKHLAPRTRERLP